MCLSNARRLDWGHGPIKCYKVLQAKTDSYVSPYLGMEYKVGEEMKAIGFPQKRFRDHACYDTDFIDSMMYYLTGGELSKVEQPNYYKPSCLELEEGYLHTFADIRDAIFSFSELSRKVICECTIPELTEAYVGEASGKASFASRKLKVERIIPREELMRGLDYIPSNIVDG